MSKIISNKHTQEICGTAKKKKQKVGLCHGVFDVLHLGHVHYLKEAKSLCDLLIVSVTEDRFVNKGPGRPIFTAQQRAQMIAALECVDFVTINNAKTAIPIIKLLEPDYYIKGPDYSEPENDITNNIYLEKKEVENSGGVLIFTKGETFSSSSLINTIESSSGKNKDWWSNHRKKINFKKIDAALKAIENKKICVIGENINDIYTTCKPLGRSSKGASLVFEEGFSLKHDGGSHAVAKNISTFCKNVTLITNEEVASSSNIEILSLDLEGEISKERILDAHTSEKIIEFYSQDFYLKWGSKSIKRLKTILEKKKFDMILCIDFGHGFFFDEIIKIIEKESALLCLNVQTNAGNRGFNFPTKWSRADYLTITEEELSLTLQDRSSELLSKINTLKKLIKFKKVAITQGARGCAIFERGKLFKTPAFAENIKDRVGAGDTFLAITAPLILEMLDNYSLGLIGNLAGSQNLSYQANEKEINIEYLLKSLQHILK